MTNWEIFKRLCRIIGGQDSSALAEVIDHNCLPQLVAFAEERDLLPALATRIDEQNEQAERIPPQIKVILKQALIENTQQKLQIKAQAIKLTRALNYEGIEPLFLKGTAQLLTNTNTPIGFRKQIDIDLLLPPDQIEAGCEALNRYGYVFYDENTRELEAFTDIARAHRISTHHHHLPPMGKPGYSATLDLHRVPLRRRFQKLMPVEQLVKSAIACEKHGAKFLLPSPEFQLLHLTLGGFVHDGYAARYDFPLRAGSDYIEIINRTDFEADHQFHIKTNGKSVSALQTFEQLVSELMHLPDEKRLCQPIPIQNRLKIMEKRQNSASVASVLDIQARCRYLATSTLYDAKKMPGYFARKFPKAHHSSTAIRNG